MVTFLSLAVLRLVGAARAEDKRTFKKPKTTREISRMYYLAF